MNPGTTPKTGPDEASRPGDRRPGRGNRLRRGLRSRRKAFRRRERRGT